MGVKELKSNQSQQIQNSERDVGEINPKNCNSENSLSHTEDKTADNDIPLIRSYNKFSNKCVSEGMRNIKEIAELFRVREELRLA